MAWQCEVSPGKERHGMAWIYQNTKHGKARRCVVWLGVALPGAAWRGLDFLNHF
jgi:hypothetical protein